MLKPAKTNATYQDVIDAPEGMRAELIDGNLYLQPAPRVQHQSIVTRLSASLLRALDEKEWVILAGVEIHVPDVLVPDLSGWRTERFAPVESGTHVEVPPDWVCEVLSPSTRSYDKRQKREKYLQAGIPWLWIIDPEDGGVEIFRAKNNEWVLVKTCGQGDRETGTFPPFTAPEFSLRGIFWH